MNWIDNFVRPRMKGIFSRRDSPENLWIKCPESGQMVFHKDLENNQHVVPGSDYHMRMTAVQRLESFLDEGSFQESKTPKALVDPLKFRDEKRYVDRLKDARAKTGMQDAVKFGLGTIDDLAIAVAVQDFAFMGGSLGAAAGGAIAATFDLALENQCPAVIFTASGGARMQEGIMSLMQMPRTVAARQALRHAGLPYFVVHTNPTTGGVTASYAMLGDIHIAEPGALIGFAGPRVIEQTIREKLPSGFQRAEYLRDHGMVDMVVHRHELKATVARLARLFVETFVAPKEAEPEEEVEAEAPVPMADEAQEAQRNPPSDEATSEGTADQETIRDEPSTSEDAEEPPASADKKPDAAPS